jgi:glycosyltransferase involved in cell wall biosynthesis
METATCRSQPEQTPVLSGVAVIIPNWKEEHSLRAILHRLPTVGHVIAVSRSSHVTSDTDDAPSACIVSETRRGYGSACLRGLAVIEDRVAHGDTPPEVVVFLDADHIEQGETVAQFARPILDGETDFVLGARMLGSRARGTLPPHTAWSNRFACFLIKHLFNARYTDLGPARAIDYYALKSLAMSDRNFGWTIEMQIKAVRAKLRTKEIAVPDRGHTRRGPIREAIQGTMNAGRILYTVAKYCLLGRTRLLAVRR